MSTTRIGHVAMMRIIWEYIGESYAAGTPLQTLADRHHSTRHKIKGELQRRNLWTERPRGPQRLDRCSRGHDLEVHGRRVWRTKPDGSEVDNGRECTECKRIRARVGGRDELARLEAAETARRQEAA